MGEHTLASILMVVHISLKSCRLFSAFFHGYKNAVLVEINYYAFFLTIAEDSVEIGDS